MMIQVLTKSKRSSLPGMMPVIVLVVLSVFIALSVLINNAISLYVSTWLIFICIIYLFAKRTGYASKLRNDLNIAEMPVYISVANLFLIGAFGLFPLIDTNLRNPNLSEDNDIINSLLLIGFSLIFMWFGYGLVSSRLSQLKIEGLIHKANFKPRLHVSMKRVLGAYVGINAIRLVLFANGGGERFQGDLSFGEWEQWVNYFILLFWVLYAYIAVSAFSKKCSIWLFIAFAAFEFSFASITGWSSTFLKLGLLTMACYAYARKSIPVGWIIGFIVIGIIILPFIRAMRLVNNFTVSEIGRVYMEVLQTGEGPGLEQGLMFTNTLLTTRQAEIAQTPAIIMKLTPEIVPYRPAEEIYLIPFSIIPRSFWPDKPQWGAIGGYITRAYFNLPDSLGASAVTMVGSGYIYGGIPLAMALMFISGVFCAFFGRIMLVPAYIENRPELFALYGGITIQVFHLGEGDIIGIYQALIQLLIVYSIVILIFYTNLGKSRIGS